MKLFLSNDPRIMALQVKGDEIASEGIRTRSKAAAEEPRFEMIPLPLKLFKMLVTDYGTELTKQDEEDASDDDFEDDDDEEEGSGGGGDGADEAS